MTVKLVSALIILFITNVDSQSSDKSWLIHPKGGKSSRSVVLDDEVSYPINERLNSLINSFNRRRMGCSVRPCTLNPTFG